MKTAPLSWLEKIGGDTLKTEAKLLSSAINELNDSLSDYLPIDCTASISSGDLATLPIGVYRLAGAVASRFTNLPPAMQSGSTYARVIVSQGFRDGVNFIFVIDMARTQIHFGQQINGSIAAWYSMEKSVEVTGTLAAGATSITLSNSAISTHSTIDIYTDTYGVDPTDVSVATGAVTLTFDAQARDVSVKVKVS